MKKGYWRFLFVILSRLCVPLSLCCAVVPVKSLLGMRFISHVTTFFTLVYVVSHAVASCSWSSVSLRRRLEAHASTSGKLCIMLKEAWDRVQGEEADWCQWECTQWTERKAKHVPVIRSMLSPKQSGLIKSQTSSESADEWKPCVWYVSTASVLERETEGDTNNTNTNTRLFLSLRKQYVVFLKIYQLFTGLHRDVSAIIKQYINLL